MGTRFARPARRPTAAGCKPIAFCGSFARTACAFGARRQRGKTRALPSQVVELAWGEHTPPWGGVPACVNQQRTASLAQRTSSPVMAPGLGLELPEKRVTCRQPCLEQQGRIAWFRGGQRGYSTSAAAAARAGRDFQARLPFATKEEPKRMGLFIPSFLLIFLFSFTMYTTKSCIKCNSGWSTYLFLLTEFAQKTSVPSFSRIYV